jgi:ubiquinone/menaquinone biosynthesis C-methylase UbiE
MRSMDLQRLICPARRTSLRADVTAIEGDDVIEGVLIAEGGGPYAVRGGIPDFVSDDVARSQTVQSFGQKWAKHQYYREHTRDFYTDWYLQRYGFVDRAGLRRALEDVRFALDAGTGSGRDAANFAELSDATVYAADTSREALGVARREVTNPRVAFVQADLNHLPFPDEFFDFISCDQVIHHTPDPRTTFENLRRKLRTGGTICCYVYKKKAVLREFTDDYVRDQIRDLSLDQAMRVCDGITHLGQALARLNVDIEIEQDIPVLGIRKGKMDLQRFFHWNIMKCFWNDEFDFFTNHIVNVDWYHPEHCFRYEPETFRAWFDHGWNVQAWDVQHAGISCRARKV